MGLFEVSGYYVAEPVGHAVGDGVDCCVRGVDADSMLCEAEEGSLLGVGEGEGFQAAEDDWVCVCCVMLGFASNFRYSHEVHAMRGNCKDVDSLDATYGMRQQPSCGF